MIAIVKLLQCLNKQSKQANTSSDVSFCLFDFETFNLAVQIISQNGGQKALKCIDLIG